jgi:hypothetical protein
VRRWSAAATTRIASVPSVTRLATMRVPRSCDRNAQALVRGGPAPVRERVCRLKSDRGMPTAFEAHDGIV